MYNWKKNTAIFLACQAISILGSSLVQFAITAYITVQTKSGVYATVSILCAILPTFFLSPFAGVWADKFDRKKLIILADGGIALSTLVVAVLFLMGNTSYVLLFAVLIVRAVGAAVQTPCVGAMLPDIVPEEHLDRVNGINGSLQSLFSLASPVLGAALLPIMSLGAIFFIDIGTAAISIAVMLAAFVLPKRDRVVGVTGDYLREMKRGLSYIGKTKFLVQFFILSALYYVMMAPAAFLTQIQVVRNYGDSYWRLSAIEVGFSAGMVIGGLGITIWGGMKNRVHTMFLATFAMGLCTFLLGIRMPFAPYIVLMILFGTALPLLNTPSMALLQEHVDENYIGRVFGVMTMLNTSMMPLGMAIFGPLADVVSIEILLLTTGVGIVLASFMMLRARALVSVGAIRAGRQTKTLTNNE